MEIERKFLSSIPENISSYKMKEIEQFYICSDPVIRGRKEGDDYILTYKSKGLMEREEVNLPLTKEAYLHLLQKADNPPVKKKRYYIPIGDGKLHIDFDIFEGELFPLVMGEVEFESGTEAKAFDMRTVPFFEKEVTYDKDYHNSNLARYGLPKSFLEG